MSLVYNVRLIRLYLDVENMFILWCVYSLPARPPQKRALGVQVQH